jgi:hypothetical protein
MSDGRRNTGAAEGGRRAGDGREDGGPQVGLDRAQSPGLRRGERTEEIAAGETSPGRGPRGVRARPI